jgi:hypothetical protein
MRFADLIKDAELLREFFMTEIMNLVVKPIQHLVNEDIRHLRVSIAYYKSY